MNWIGAVAYEKMACLSGCAVDSGCINRLWRYIREKSSRGTEQKWYFNQRCNATVGVRRVDSKRTIGEQSVCRTVAGSRVISGVQWRSWGVFAAAKHGWLFVAERVYFSRIRLARVLYLWCKVWLEASRRFSSGRRICFGCQNRSCKKYLGVLFAAL